MKRPVLLCLFVALTFAVSWAKEVTAPQAQEYAIAFLQARSSKKISVRNIQVMGEHKTCYLVNFSPQGWALISADDVAAPVIGYSLEGNLHANRLPGNMKFMLNECEREITRAAIKTNDTHRQWKSSPRLSARLLNNRIEPLIRVNWNQDAPYNVYCPKKEALVGCVAVSMGQAMSVQHFPQRPAGQVSYSCENYGRLSIDFDAEKEYSWDDIMSGANDSDEVARLLFHTGMSVEMSYGTDGSGIAVNKVGNISDALNKHFAYSNTSHTWREKYEGDWEQFLLNELTAGRAIIYNAIDSKASSGHSFNVDGYDGEGRFHVNWGWGGYGNSYFSINGLSDAYQGFDYDNYHVVITGVGISDRVLKFISLSNNRVEEGLPAGAAVGSVLVNGEEPKANFSITVQGAHDSKTEARSQVPFSYEGGILKTTEVLNAQTKTWNIEITVTDADSETTLTQGFRITVDTRESLGEATKLTYERQTGILTLKTKRNVNYVLKSENGSVLKSGSLDVLPELSIDTGTLPAGKNAIELKCAGETKVIRIVTK